MWDTDEKDFKEMDIAVLKMKQSIDTRHLFWHDNTYESIPLDDSSPKERSSSAKSSKRVASMIRSGIKEEEKQFSPSKTGRFGFIEPFDFKTDSD